MSVILTPVSLWKGFDDTLPLSESLVKETNLIGYKLQEVYFSGRETGAGRPRIAANFAFHSDGEARPTILIFFGIEEAPDMELFTYLLDSGYNVLSVDYSGKTEKTALYTKYPEDIPYANYCESGRAFGYADNTAKETSWYEWTAVGRYAVSFLLSKPQVDKGRIGVLGVRHGGEIVWKLAGTDARIRAAVSVFGAGWEAYRGALKYSDKSDIEMDEERYRWIAGVDSYAYAQHIKCPIFLLGCTNDDNFSSDRGRDTVARVNQDIDSFADYSNGLSNCIDKKSFDNIGLFFAKYLENRDLYINEAADISVVEDGGSLYLETDADENCQEIEIFYSNGNPDPVTREWRKAEAKGRAENGKYRFKPALRTKEGIFLAYSRVKFKSGFTVSSALAAKDLSKSLVECDTYAKRVVFSKQVRDSITIKNPRGLYCGFALAAEDHINILKGPFGFEGVYSEFGLKSYVSRAESSLKEDSLLLLDVYTKEYAVFSVSIVSNYKKPDTKRFTSKIKLEGGELWHKLKLSREKFKTAEGMPLSDMRDAEVIVIECEGFFLVNNVIIV